VSALIHAATMVTAGVFLLARFSPMLELAPAAMAATAALGAATALVAATIALVQTDIKRVIAYSTMSQLGYMVLAAGVGAWGAAVFHLVTHAFFKALLFLGAGSVIHAMGGEQDMRRMGGLARVMPWTAGAMAVGAAALAGLPPLAGFYSKDAILEAAFVGAPWVFGVGIAVAVLTAVYAARLMWMTFGGAARWPQDGQGGAHPHESPWVMLWPLLALAVGAVAAGAALYGPMVGHHDAWAGTVAQAVPEGAHHVAFWVKALPTAAALLGLALAFALYRRAGAGATRLAARAPWAHRLLLNTYYFDEAYRAALLRPAQRLGVLFAGPGDRGTIDRLGPDGAAAASAWGARGLSAAQTGRLPHYALVMVAALAALGAWALLFAKT
jgi:NADH-quinone oxidoreductase subunit L